MVSPDDQVDTSALDAFLFHCSQRVAGLAYTQFLNNTAQLGLSGSTEFSVLNLIAHNPGMTSRQICATLSVQPPNMVMIIKNCEDRGLVEKKRHPVDHRAYALYLTEAGMIANAQAQVALKQGDDRLLSHLRPVEREELMLLLQRLY